MSDSLKTFLMVWTEPRYRQHKYKIITSGVTKGECFGKILNHFKDTDPKDWRVIYIKPDEGIYYDVDTVDQYFFLDEGLLDSLIESGWNSPNNKPEDLYLEIMFKEKVFWGDQPHEYTFRDFIGVFYNDKFWKTNPMDKKEVECTNFFAWKIYPNE